MLEFVVTAEIGAVFGPAVGPMLGRAVGVIVGKRLGKIVEERAASKKAEQACAEALQEWLVALIRGFKECGIKDEDLQRFFPEYIGAVEAFLEDDEVSAELLRPFTDSVPDPTLDGRLLVDRWQTLSLPALPEGFNADRACRWYVERLNQMRQAIEVLRPLWQAQVGQRHNVLLQDIRGQWATWDLDLYADATRETYQALDITTLQPTGHYELESEPIKLRDIFIPLHARRSLPDQVLPRDYLEKLRYKALEDAPLADALFEQDGEANGHWDKTSREPVLDILTAANVRHLVVLGDAGAGKSCLARYITLSLVDGLGLGHYGLEASPLPGQRSSRTGCRF